MFELSNHIDYIIAEKYMIVVFKKKIYCFSYADIERIIKVDEYRFYPNYLYHEYLTIVLKNEKKIRLLAFSTVCFGQENIDVEKCLLEKNSKIIIEKEKTRIHWLK